MPTTSVLPPRNIPEIFQIFHNVQFNTAQHKKYIKELLRVYEKIDEVAFRESFTNALHYLFTFGDKSPNVDRVIEFVAKFCTSVDENEEFLVFVFGIIFECQNASGQAVRFRATQLVSAILSALGDDAALEDDLCDKLSGCQRDRLQDTRCAVRSRAVEALQRLQNPLDPNDPITEAYQFHVHCDPSAAVRRAIVACMAKCTLNLKFVIQRLRDVDEAVRRAAFNYVSTINITQLKVRERILILTIGLTERSSRVRRVVDEKLIPEWLGSLNGNILDLLKAVRLDNLQGAKDSQFVAGKMLESLFKRLPVSELLEWLPMEDNLRLVSAEKLGKETAWYWRHLAMHLHQINDIDTLEKIIPDLVIFVKYIRVIVESPWPNAQSDPVSFSTKQYVLHELAYMLQVYDVLDEVGRSALQQLLYDVLTNGEITLLPEVVYALMTAVRAVLPDLTRRVDFAVSIIQELRDPGEPEPSPEDRMIASTPVEDIATKMKRAGLRVSLNEALESQEEAVRAQNYTLAAECKDRVDRIHRQLDELNVALTYKQLATSEKEKIEVQEQEPKSDSETLNKCLLIINTLLDTPDITTITPVLQTLYQEFEELLFQSDDVRQNGMKTVALYSMLDAKFAQDNKTYFFRQLITVDDQEVMSIALRCLIDILCVHGTTIFDEEPVIPNATVDGSTLDNSKNGKSKNSTVASSVIECSDFYEEDVTVMSTGAPGTVLGMLLKLLDSDVEEYRLIVVEGLCRLLTIGRLVSSSIVSRLILVWFNPANEKEDLLRQTIGVFFSSWTSRSVGGLTAAEQICSALLPTLRALCRAPVNSPLANIDVEPILRFIIGLTRADRTKDDSLDLHGSLGASLVARMMGNGATLDEAPAICRAMALLSPPQCLTLAKQLLTSVDALLEQLIERNVVDKQSIKNVARYQASLTVAVTNYSRLESLSTGNFSSSAGCVTAGTEGSTETSNAERKSSLSKRVTIQEPAKDTENNDEKDALIEEASDSDDGDSTLKSVQPNVTIPQTPESSDHSESDNNEGDSTIHSMNIDPKRPSSIAELDGTPIPKHRSTKNPSLLPETDPDVTPKPRRPTKKFSARSSSEFTPQPASLSGKKSRDEDATPQPRRSARKVKK